MYQKASKEIRYLDLGSVWLPGSTAAWGSEEGVFLSPLA